jgi:hypothetical protein
MAGNPSLDARLHRRGLTSAFLAYQAGLFALGFWVWLLVLVLRGLPVSGWHVLAATGATTATLTAVVLAARYTNDRAAADRHDVAMRAVVELSWETFTAALRSGPDRQPPGSIRSDSEHGADVIALSHESRPRRSR